MSISSKFVPLYGIILFLGTGIFYLGWAGDQEWWGSVLAGTGVPGFSGDGGCAIAAQLNNPFGVARGPDGALYVCDTGNHCIRRIDEKGTITTVAGVGGRSGYSGDGGLAVEALLFEPYEVRFDKVGNMFFVEMRNHVIRRVDAVTGKIGTLAGTGQPGYSGDGGKALQAQFRQPHSIQFGPDGDLYVCDIGNHRIRVIRMKTGFIEHYSGSGVRGKPVEGEAIEMAPWNGPRALDFDREGNLWLALREGNAIYRINQKLRTLHHVAGTGKSGFGGHGGPAREAPLAGPKGIAISPSGNIFLADTESHSVRMVDAVKGTLEWIAGTGQRGDGGRCEANARECAMARPHGIFVDTERRIYVGDSETHQVRCLEIFP